MFVSSNGFDEPIHLPALNVSINFLSLDKGSGKASANTPIKVKIVRNGNDSTNFESESIAQSFSISGDSDHEIRNKVQGLSFAVGIAERLIKRGDFNLAAAKLQRVIEEIRDTPAVADTAETFSALLVEDVENEREMLAGFLRLHGYHVDTVADGMAALDYLESNSKPNLIMLDIGMPRMNGAELIGKIRENSSFDRIKLIAISGDTPEQANLDLEMNRIDKWFQKPVQPAQLIAEISQELKNLNG